MFAVTDGSIEKGKAGISFDIKKFSVPRDPVKVRLARYYGKSVQEIFFDPEVHEM